MSPPEQASGSFSDEIEARIARQRVFATETIEIGRFDASPEAPDFRFSGPPGRYHVVFPETSVRIRHAGGDAFVTDLNTVTFYNPSDLYFREVVDPRGDVCTWLAAARALVDEMVGELCDVVPRGPSDAVIPFAFGPLESRDFCRHRRLLADLGSSDLADPLAIEEQAIDLFASAIAASVHARDRLRESRARLGAAALASRRRLFRRAVEILATSSDASPSLAELGREIGCSPFHLCRVFRAESGTTLHQYRLELRVRRVLDLLRRDADRTLSDIAAEVGFASHSHLTEVFKSRMGRLPSRFRSELEDCE